MQTTGTRQKSIWRKISETLLYGILAYLILLCIAILTKYFKQETITVVDFANPIMGFFLLAYWKIIEFENCFETIDQTLSPRLRKGARAFRFWLYALAIWVVMVLIIGFLLSQFPNVYFALAWLFLAYVLIFLLFSLSVFPLIASIPSGRFLSSIQVNTEKKMKVAHALTLLTPLLGLPWLIDVSLILQLTSIEVKPNWIIYIVFIFIYVTLYFLFVDLPYSVSMRETKKKELDRLANERNEILKKLGKTDDYEKSLLDKVVFELEIARIDREEKKAKSESIHPYKIIIPLASFFLGIFGALLIEFVKSIIGI